MLDAICAWDNLLLAYRRAARGKRGLPPAARFEYRLEDNLLALQSELRARTYVPGAYASFHIHEPKRRLISAAPFRDRVVHHALCNVIEPVFDRAFIFDSYANRRGKGTHRALDRCQAFARRYRYVLACDIRQFFPSIDHAILIDRLARVVRPDALWLCERIVSSGAGVLSEAYDMEWFPGDNLFAALRPRGLPIGNLTSQFWANCYLDPFDHFVKRELRCAAYIRYVDDFLLFADDPADLRRWLAAIHARLARLRLSVHAGAHAAPVSDGIGFLGFRVHPQSRRLKRRNVIAFRRGWRALCRGYRHGDMPLDRLSATARGWANHARYGNTLALRRAVFARTIVRDAS